MKNIKTAILAFCICSISNIIAQDDKDNSSSEHHLKVIEFGVRFMPSFNSFDLKSNSTTGDVESSVTLGYGFGAALGLNITEHFGVQVEAIYNSLSQKYKVQGSDQEINVRYVNIPLLLSINTNKTRIINLNIVAGPQLGINVGSNIKKLNGGSSDSLSGIFGVKKNDIGIVYGAGLEFMVNDRRTIRLGLGYRGMFGFTNISNTSQTIDNTSYYILNTANIRSNAIYIGLSFLL